MAEVEKWLETTKVKDINCKRGGECSTNNFEVRDGTALHWAAYYGKVEIVKKCLESGASMFMIIVVYSCVARGMGVYSGILVLLMGWLIFGRL